MQGTATRPNSKADTINILVTKLALRGEDREGEEAEHLLLTNNMDLTRNTERTVEEVPRISPYVRLTAGKAPP